MIERIHRLKSLTVGVKAGRGAMRHYRVVKPDGALVRPQERGTVIVPAKNR